MRHRTQGGALLIAALWIDTPGVAASAGNPDDPGYSATLAAPTGERLAVAGGVTWTCARSGCLARAGDARPLAACRALARQVGRVASFTAGGVAFTAEELRRCNRTHTHATVQRVFPPQF